MDGTYTSLEAALHRPTVMSCDLPWLTSSCNNTRIHTALTQTQQNPAESGTQILLQMLQKLAECVFLGMNHRNRIPRVSSAVLVKENTFSGLRVTINVEEIYLQTPHNLRRVTSRWYR